MRRKNEFEGIERHQAMVDALATPLEVARENNRSRDRWLGARMVGTVIGTYRAASELQKIADHEAAVYEARFGNPSMEQVRYTVDLGLPVNVQMSRDDIFKK